MKFLYYLAAIGGPNLEQKLKILARNLIYINHTLKQHFSIAVNCYDNRNEVSEFIKRFSFLDAVYFHYRPNSVLSELWFTNPYIKLIDTYDEVLFILDDVSVSRLSIPKLLDIRRSYNIDIISPAIIGATWPYMMSQKSDKLAFTNHLEIYCMLMTPQSFRKYLSINTFRNKWIWGVDHLFGHFDVRTAVYYGMNAFHLLPAAHGRSDEAYRLMMEYLRKLGFNNLGDVKKKYPAIKKVISI